MSLTITCTTCAKEFTMSDEEVAYFEKMGYQNRKHCPECSAKRKAERSAPRELVEITCSQCGRKAQVPHPNMTLCSECHKASKNK